MTAPTPDYEALTRRMEEIIDRGKIDAVAAPNLILLLADAFDADALDTMRMIRDVAAITPTPPIIDHLDRFGQIIWDILETSQSNFNRSIEDLIEVLTIEEEMGDPEFR